MRPIALKVLTWATVAAAVASALWLAAVEADHGPLLRLAASSTAAVPLGWPSDPAVAGLAPH